MPYYPIEWPGGDRVTAWKNEFENKGYKVEIFNAWSNKEIENLFQYKKNNNDFKLYVLYFKLLFRRVSIIKRIYRFETIWIQRAFIPVFPFKKSYYEKYLSKIHNHVVYDYYDSDYESNRQLVFETVEYANQVTVASQFLKDKFINTNNDILFLRYCINTSKYEKKTNFKSDSKTIKIGWMGSPSNSIHLNTIANQLREIENNYPNAVFSIVCRVAPDLGLKNAEYLNWDIKGFNYYEWLKDLDIGIVPFIGEGDRIKAKISMKSLEFMYVGIPQITSLYVHSDRLLDGINGFISNEDEWYIKIEKLILDEELRHKFSVSLSQEFEKYHTRTNSIIELTNFLENKK